MVSNETDPITLLFDPNIILTPELFLYTFTSWASMPPPNTTPEEILSRFEIRTITLKKITSSPEHEFIVLETVDKSDSHLVRQFILDRSFSRQIKGSTAPEPDPAEEAQSHKIAQRIKRFVVALATLVSTPSAEQDLASTKGSESSLQPHHSLSIIADKSTLSLTETASLVSDTLDISEDFPAYDRFLGEINIYAPRWDGETIRTIQPKNLTLFQLVVLSQITHMLYPTYSLLKHQCYFYAGIIFAAVEKNWEIADQTKGVVDSGRYKGFKIKRINRDEVSNLISEYNNFHSQKVDKVILFIYNQSAYHLLQYSTQIMEMARARQDRTNWEKVKNIVIEEANLKEF